MVFPLKAEVRGWAGNTLIIRKEHQPEIEALGIIPPTIGLQFWGQEPERAFCTVWKLQKVRVRVDWGCWWQDLLDPYRWAVCLSSYSDADDSLSSVCVQARIWILADMLGESICSAEAVVFDWRMFGGGGKGRRMSRRNSVRILPFHENSELCMGGWAGSGMVWAIIIPRDEGDMLKWAVSLLFGFCTWVSPNFK